MSCQRAVAPFQPRDDAAPDAAVENPYTVHTDLQQTMNDLVGIIRREEEVREALERLDELERRADRVVVEGHRQFNPGWHLALDLQNMILVSRCIAMAALERTEETAGATP